MLILRAPSMTKSKTALKPRYMKVDVEGHDLDCVSSLAKVSRPRFCSIELPTAEDVAALADVFRSRICMGLVVFLSFGKGPAAGRGQMTRNDVAILCCFVNTFMSKALVQLTAVQS